MKKLLVIAVASLSIAAIQARASVTVEVDGADLFVASGPTLAPTSTVGLLIVDKSSDGISNGPLTAGFSIAIGATFGGSDNVIVDKVTILASTATPGALAFNTTFNLSGGIAAGQRIALLWMPDQNIGTATATVGSYGWFSRSSWLVPSDGSSVALDGIFTVSAGGTDPNSTGFSNFAIVPEPSAVTLVCLGLLGAFGLRRRS